jgi:cytochrome P450
MLTGFGLGARVCIGKQLAMFGSKIAVISFLKRYNKIILAKDNFKMLFLFSYYPEKMNTKLVLANEEKS